MDSKGLEKEGEELLLNEKYAEAVEVFTKAIKTGSEPSRIIPRRAWAFLKMGESVRATEEFSKAIELNPGNAHYYSERGVARLNQGHYALALMDFNEALNLEPENPYRYASRGYVLDRVGERESALNDYRKALELDPDDEITRNNLELLSEKMSNMRDDSGMIVRPYVNDSSPADLSEVDLPEQGSSLLREIGKVFTSRESFKEFLRFLSGKR